MSTGEGTAAAYFDARAAHYDTQARLGIPRYDPMIRQLVWTLTGDPRQILELGCGTGVLTTALARRFPSAELAAVDASPQMLECARARLAKLPGVIRVHCLLADFERLDLNPESLDLVTSCMALHHVANKAPLFANLGRALRPGGQLIFADELRATADAIESLHWNAWLAFARQPGHLTPAEIEDTLRHVETQDHYETLPAELDLLREAGFREVDCVWRYLNYAIFTASG